jgi:hypothetical protein
MRGLTRLAHGKIRRLDPRRCRWPHAIGSRNFPNFGVA